MVNSHAVCESLETMGIRSNSNKIVDSRLRLGPLSSMHRPAMASRPAGFRALLIASVFFVFELSWFVHNVVDNPVWFQFNASFLNAFIESVLDSGQLIEVPDALVYQMGDGALVFLFFLNLVCLRPSPLPSKAFLMLFMLACLVFVHAASIAIFLAQGGAGVSPTEQLAIAAPCATLTIAAFLWWSRRQP